MHDDSIHGKLYTKEELLAMLQEELEKLLISDEMESSIPKRNTLY
jgi:hypothetical protein